MALFIDGEISSMEDLTGQDSQLADVASTEGINVTTKLALAHEELEIELSGLLADLSGVVVTPALRLWHTYRTLELVYGDAYHSQLNDRYKGKRDQFEQRARWAYDKLVQGGIGMAMDPVRQAATPIVGTAPGTMPSGTYFVTMAWINASGQEGACADAASITIAETGMMVTPANVPAGVAGWNVYAGTSPDTMVRQNEAPLAPGQPWMGDGAPAASSEAPPTGQAAEYTQPVEDTAGVVRLIRRG